MNPRKSIPDDLDRDLEGLGLIRRIDSDESRLGVGPYMAAYLKFFEDVFTGVRAFLVRDVRGLFTSNIRDVLAITEGASSEKASFHPRLKALVVDPINDLSMEERIVKGQLRTGEDFARAIPNVEAFLREIDLMKHPKFCEINKEGQLVMMDGERDAYGLGEDFPTARDRQARVAYRDEAGNIQVLVGHCFKVDRRTGNLVLNGNKGTIKAKSILMIRRLPTLYKDENDKYAGEYARMNTGQFDVDTYTWVKDDSLDSSSTARYADCNLHNAVIPYTRSLSSKVPNCGSRGVLSVNLNFESDADSSTSDKEVVPEIDSRLMDLLVRPINALPAAKRTINGRVLTGQEIARDIPDVEAFLNEIGLMNKPEFLEISSVGQLLIKDEVSGLGESGIVAQIRQKRIVYREKNGAVRVMAGMDCFIVDADGKLLLSHPFVGINPASVLMHKDFPFLHVNYDLGQVDPKLKVWVFGEGKYMTAHVATDRFGRQHLCSDAQSPHHKSKDLGSCGILSVNLNLESGLDPEEPSLAPFKAQFEALSATARRNMSWVQVVRSMSQPLDVLLSNIAKLESPQVFEVDDKNNLVFCDGGDEVPSFTLDGNYSSLIRKAKNKGLEAFTGGEYERFYAQGGEGRYDKTFRSYISVNGDGWSHMLHGKACLHPCNNCKCTEIGMRRILRVKLHFPFISS